MFIDLVEGAGNDLILIDQGQTQDLSRVSVKIKYSLLIKQLPLIHQDLGRRQNGVSSSAD